MSETEGISTEFLEKALGKNIDSFTITAQPDTGDNFMSIISTLDVQVSSPDGTSEALHLLSKCYPLSSGRQEFLKNRNIFWKELQMYKVFIPEILEFQKDLGVREVLKPDFPTLAAGEAINFHENSNLKGKYCLPFDNYIMMEDLCKTRGFKMADRLVGLDFYHLALSVEALAKLHALSWAYKKHKNIDDITKKFPSMKLDVSAEKPRRMFQKMINSSIDESIGALKSTFGEDSHLVAAFENFKEPSIKIFEIVYGYGNETEIDLEKYRRVKQNSLQQTSKEIPWKVVVHGDCHMNNMLFRYNSVTNKPEECVLVDLPRCREACPVTDLVFIIYTSTTSEFRYKHLDDIINIYFEKFNNFCKHLKIETLPGFTFSELKRRFDRMKGFGLMMGTVDMPIFLKPRENAVQLDSLKDISQEEIFLKIGKDMSTNSLYAKRIAEFVLEMYNEGLL